MPLKELKPVIQISEDPCEEETCEKLSEIPIMAPNEQQARDQDVIEIEVSQAKDQNESEILKQHNIFEEEDCQKGEIPLMS